MASWGSSTRARFLGPMIGSSSGVGCKASGTRAPCELKERGGTFPKVDRVFSLVRSATFGFHKRCSSASQSSLGLTASVDFDDAAIVPALLLPRPRAPRRVGPAIRSLKGSSPSPSTSSMREGGTHGKADSEELSFCAVIAGLCCRKDGQYEGKYVSEFESP